MEETKVQQDALTKFSILLSKLKELKHIQTRLKAIAKADEKLKI